VILGGYLSDLWRQRDPRGRLFVNMISAVVPIPLIAIHADHRQPVLASTSPQPDRPHASPPPGSARRWRRLQDLVLPRMRATAGATYILGTTMVGLALGPYFAGKMSVLAGDLGTGIFALYVMPPFTVLGLWLGGRRSPSWRRPRSSAPARHLGHLIRLRQPNTPQAILAPLFPAGSVR
jgi:hypothetical protein